MPVSREKKIYRNFIISTSMVVAAAVSGVFLNMAVRTGQLMTDGNLIEARVVFNTIALARKWNADYGGVYVEKRPGVESNRFLQDPDLHAGGQILTKRNHAVMTRELSGYAAREGLFRFQSDQPEPPQPGEQTRRLRAGSTAALREGGKRIHHGRRRSNSVPISGIWPRCMWSVTACSVTGTRGTSPGTSGAGSASALTSRTSSTRSERIRSGSSSSD